MGWTELVRVPPEDVQTINSPEVQDRMRDECLGQFQNRYDCKESIILATSRETFASLTWRFGLVTLVPVLAAMGYGALSRKERTPHDLVGPDDLAWKHLAEDHIVHPAGHGHATAHSHHSSGDA